MIFWNLTNIWFRKVVERLYDGGSNLTPTIQSTVCKISKQPWGAISSLALDVSTLNLVSFLTLRRFFPAALIDIHLLVLIKRGNVYQSWRNPRLTRLWNNKRIQKQWTWTPPVAQKCRWKGNLKCRRIKQKSAKVNQIIYCSFEFQDQFRATSFLHYVLKSSTSFCGRFYLWKKNMKL